MVIYVDLLLGALLNCPVTNPIVLSRNVSISPRAEAALNHHLFLEMINSQQDTEEKQKLVTFRQGSTQKEKW